MVAHPIGLYPLAGCIISLTSQAQRICKPAVNRIERALGTAGKSYKLHQVSQGIVSVIPARYPCG